MVIIWSDVHLIGKANVVVENEARMDRFICRGTENQLCISVVELKDNEIEKGVDKMTNLKRILATSIIFGVLSFAALGASEPDPNDPNWAKVHEMRIEFEKRYNAWNQYIKDTGIGCSSLVEDYIENEPFRRLLEIGPVAVPWYIEAEPSPFMHTALQLVLRADWTAMAGYSEEQQMRENMYVALKNWWKTGRRSAPTKVKEHVDKFRAWLKSQPKDIAFSQVRETSRWRELCQTGLFGVPFTIQRIRLGIADEYDYRLLCYWTDPIEYNDNDKGFPKPPTTEKKIVTASKRNPNYWLDWWQKNRWQFWWLSSP
jgi:hypothetical protein